MSFSVLQSLVIPVLPASLRTIGGALGGQVTASTVTSGRRSSVTLGLAATRSAC